MIKPIVEYILNTYRKAKKDDNSQDVLKTDKKLIEMYRQVNEKIGIDLNTIIDALADGIYIKLDNGDIIKDEVQDIQKFYNGFYYLVTFDSGDVETERYGETWALDMDGFE